MTCSLRFPTASLLLTILACGCSTDPRTEDPAGEGVSMGSTSNASGPGATGIDEPEGSGSQGGSTSPTSGDPSGPTTDGTTSDPDTSDSSAEASTSESGDPPMGDCANGGGPGAPPTPQCADLDVDTLTLCIEHASACPGDTVSLDLYVLAPAGCSGVVLAGTILQAEGWAVANEAMHTVPTDGRCVRRVTCDTCDPDLLDWALLPGFDVGVPACPDSYPLTDGPIDTLEVQLPADLEPGEYPLFGNSANIGVNAACGGNDVGIGFESNVLLHPTIRVD